jgi:pimeloyl-ACP methyl ester carboxylesterase
VRGRVRKGLVASSGDPSWVTDSVVAAYTAGATRDLGATLRTFARIAESREPATLAPQLAAIRCPVVLLVGLAPHSEAVPAAEVERLRRGVAAFAVDSVAGAGHHVHEEQPLRVAAAIRAAHERGAVMALRSDP